MRAIIMMIVTIMKTIYDSSMLRVERLRGSHTRASFFYLSSTPFAVPIDISESQIWQPMSWPS